MRSLPEYDPKNNVCQQPHIVVLGAGASRAAFPEGDGSRRKLPLMNELVKTIGLENDIIAIGKDPNDNFEKIYSEAFNSEQFDQELKGIESKIKIHFEGMELSSEPTLYDYLVLSLREKDLIATFNWDPLLIQAFRRNSNLKSLPKLSFLHGNVGVGVCLEDRITGYIGDRCSKCHKILSPAALLYPVENKNYDSDPFIKSEWGQFSQELSIGYYLTIFGYSAPKTDVAAREVMLNAWANVPTFNMNEVEIIDIQPKEQVRESWAEFFHSHHYSVIDDFKKSSLWYRPRRTCESLASATLKCEPMHTVEYPQFDDIKDLHDWIKPLIQEEQIHSESGTGLSKNMKEVLAKNS